MWVAIVLQGLEKKLINTLHLILNIKTWTNRRKIKNKMLLDDFKTRYPKASLDKFTFVNDSYGGYIKWKVNGTTIMSNDDPTGKTWTDDLPSNLKTLLWQEI